MITFAKSITTGPPSAPTAPLEISTLGPHALTIEWGAPESDGGAPLEGYKIAVRDARRQMWMEVGRVKSDVQKLKVQDLAVRLRTRSIVYKRQLVFFVKLYFQKVRDAP